MSLNLEHTMQLLPSLSKENWQKKQLAALAASGKIIVVLDDDPTGTQTVHGVPVVTVWDAESLVKEIENGSRLFYILTNSRSMKKAEADKLNQVIGENILTAFAKCNKEFIVISRSDSTLRGHYPNEVVALAQGLGYTNYDTAIIPAFFEGGRYTIDDIHYVKEGTELIPAAETVFAKDKAFCFSNSDLKKWVEEKTNGGIKAAVVINFSIEEIRNHTIEQLSEKINQLKTNSTFIVNAADYEDLEKWALAYMQTDAKILFRTAASFVKALGGISFIPPLQKEQLIDGTNTKGGIIMVGSYVEKTTKQLAALQTAFFSVTIELNIEEILNDVDSVYSDTVNLQIHRAISKGTDVLVFTGRKLFVSESEKENLSVNNKVSLFITNLAATLQVQPGFFIAKGGITSSDIATKAFGVKRAVIIGQALPGVPVWKLGSESKFPGMSYIIFPGM